MLDRRASASGEAKELTSSATLCTRVVAMMGGGLANPLSDRESRDSTHSRKRERRKGEGAERSSSVDIDGAQSSED